MTELDILRQLPDWSIVDQKLHREFEFKDFIQAFGFMAQAAIIAEKMNHHPEWSNVYKIVIVELTTHSKGRISSLDIELAAQMNNIFEQLSK
ncbi:4a-hydroxytetrahydrobiopterin dehydratase [Candidatus Thioglobus sp.]|jgi:4a-hydroxytetrahydrobiopterin dehydratase|uniref:4a-hydroxytetrahydrobiopterin dehydratase n=1 Tax=Candidatus Thioglobus sp. TaxID=2026721 RepID=UPI001772B858|nr:4a-hydroxytetrahydrobiopterin dehydratase [Candidatus Thioglobus sp.]HIF47580.1 4a-hydroxytetrahydrobiopterin dehydratase [Candidatus Thioglobus sp.]HIL04099.1 4a-hydroxytetrahydrobiopterin dehydratase [Candidatus Thioglobus autotrophicus]